MEPDKGYFDERTADGMGIEKDSSIHQRFFESYLHYSVAQRLFEDTCRQLRDCKGTLDERQALVDETLRLAMCVSDNIDETEGLLADTLEELQSKGYRKDIMDALPLISNNLKEDRARANSYSNYITYRRIGNMERRPRRPQVANPFIPLVDDGTVPEENGHDEGEGQ